MNRFLLLPSLVIPCLSAWACSGGQDAGEGNAGGTPSTGGAAAGGSTPTGGAPLTGGASSTGGSVSSSGGAVATGGTSSSGGSNNTGGSSGGTGGSNSSGGSNGLGGTAPSGPKDFVGNITTGNNQINVGGRNFATYWNQITPENAGKWGSVQFSTSAGFNWASLDAIYDYAQDNGILFKQHAFVWGSQQPSGTPTQAQVINWIRSFCQRYPNTALIDVVNEPPPHTTPNYVNNIGGGTNGNWAWITNSFIWAHENCPNAVLMLNDFNNIEWPDDNQRIIDIVNTVLANGGPIDAIGAQAHDLDHEAMTAAQVTELLTKLHDDTGLPVYITEMDLSYSDDQQQLAAYQEYFPVFMNASFVPGITIWGWIYGQTWNQAPSSGLIRNGNARPAMTWLMQQLGRPAP